jgi:hypothetical protein
MEHNPPGDEEAVALTKSENETQPGQVTADAKASGESLPPAKSETGAQATTKRPWWKFWG